MVNETLKRICRSYMLLVTIITLSHIVYGQQEYKFSVSSKDIVDDYIPVQVELKYYNKPVVRLENVKYSSLNQLPDNASAFARRTKIEISLGKERKSSFAIVRVPAYSFEDNGVGVKQVEEFTLNILETAPETLSNSNIKTSSEGVAKSTSINSPLASGVWYKIAVSQTGLYKVDYNFVSTQLGLSGVSSSQIRVFGSGGKMLPEKNSTDEIEGLTENAIWINDGGDGNFDPGDYFVFFAQGILNWSSDSNNSRLIPEKNLYSDKAYYFLNFEELQGKRVSKLSTPPAANMNVDSYTGAVLHENDLANPQQYGKRWWGEEFSNAPGKQNTQNIKLSLGNTISDADFRINLVNTSSSPAQFEIKLNGQNMLTTEIGAANNYEYAPKAIGKENIFNAKVSGDAVFQITYNGKLNDGSGWLDFISVTVQKPLSMDENSMIFVDLNSVGFGNIANYNISGATGSLQVWDVTDSRHPVSMTGSLNGNVFSFSQVASELHNFVAVNDPAKLTTPEFVSIVPNQNLFGSPQVDYIIITNPDFKNAAQELANFHRQHSRMRVIVATTTQVYNEFSSGSQDISALRDFARMFYQRAGMYEQEMPKYLLLLGDASYDYKDRIKNNTNYVPTFEAWESYDLLNTFSNDDFFGFLDDNENIEDYFITNTIDIGIGRIPAKTPQEANDVVKKIIHYKSQATLDPYRINNMYVADNEDAAGEFINSTEIMKSTVDLNSSIHNSVKVYEDAIPFISTPGGQRAPEANKSINEGIKKGLFMINYIGHGNPSVLAHERILTIDDYSKWRNIDKLPFMVTATCDFGQFDQPSFVSSGERLLLKSDGGTIAMLTTTQLVYNYANEILNREYLDAQFSRINGKWNTFGDAVRIGKNGTYKKASSGKDLIVNFRKFVLLGDPALTPNFPQYNIKSSSVVDVATGSITKSIKALGEYVVNGEVTDIYGNLLTDFNGQLSVAIFDKPRNVRTISSVNKIFSVRNNTIYKGKATVANGKFSFSFITPKDVNYEFGNGFISYYAENGITDAAGSDTSVIIGGYSDNPRIEYMPPIVKAYIKDSLFRNGGLTGSNTALFAVIEDETGINVSGNSIGHDLTAVLDGDVSQPYIMNDYYETALNTYKKGYVYFPIEGIPDGLHRLAIKAWDVNNNSGEGYVDFVVKDGQVVVVQNLGNYPNPFRDKTTFIFEHNRPDEDLKAEINIYNTSGLLVRKLEEDFFSTGSRSTEVSWDATDNNGAKLPSGLYIYKMKISTERGIESTGYQKLVIVQ